MPTGGIYHTGKIWAAWVGMLNCAPCVRFWPSTTFGPVTLYWGGTLNFALCEKFVLGTTFGPGH